MSDTNFHEARRGFRALMLANGMEREGADYCISVGRKLRKIYAEAKQVEALEAEAVLSFQNFLGRLPSVYEQATDTHHSWECVIGGLDDGDTNILYVVPPMRVPALVPLPGIEAAVSKVGAIIKNWDAPPVKAEEPKIDHRDRYGEYEMRVGRYEGMMIMGEEQARMMREMWNRAKQQEKRMQREYIQNYMHDEYFIKLPTEEEVKKVLEATNEWWKHKNIHTPPQRSNGDDKFEHELHERAKREGWSDAVRASPKYREFINAMMASRKASKLGDQQGRIAFGETAHRLYQELRSENYNIEKAREYGINHLREKEQREKRR